jgi:hypothetical protein
VLRRDRGCPPWLDVKRGCWDVESPSFGETLRHINMKFEA